jgi:DNA-directed RNA polymerase beta' subunit
MNTEIASDIKEVCFGILSTDEILKISVVEVTSPKISATEKENTVYDIRMGPTIPYEVCPTCKLKALNCPGHWGHIKLNVPIVHPLHYRRVTQFLNCICIQCSRLLVNEDHLRLWNILRYKKENRFNAILEKILKIRLCVNCNLTQPDISFVSTEHMYYIVYSTKSGVVEKLPLHTEEIKRIFSNLRDGDIQLLGFQPSVSHPKNLIMDVIPVLPPRSRPFIVTENMICDDDLTIQFTEIIKSNNNLNVVGLPETRREKYIQNLVFWIKTLMDNSKGLAKHNNSKPMQGIKERLSSKTGIIRNNLMGIEMRRMCFVCS